MQIALVGQGKFLLSDQRVDVETVLAVAKQMGFIVKDNAVCNPVALGVKLKPSWTTFRANVRKRRLRELYHFRPLDNLPGIIATGALLSRRQMDERGIRSMRNSWGNPEKERALGTDYICLSITNQWKMLSSVMIWSIHRCFV